MDTFYLRRFKEAQKEAFPRALEEIRQGRKRSHWIWYIFPQLKGLGHSWEAEYYGISGKNEAVAYLNDPQLSENLISISHALLALEQNDPVEIMGGEIDAMKLFSCMTLFEAVCPDAYVFSEVLERFFNNERDELTLSML